MIPTMVPQKTFIDLRDKHKVSLAKINNKNKITIISAIFNKIEILKDPVETDIGESK